MNLVFAHLQVVLVVDIHPLQGTTHPLVCADKEHNSEATCGIGKETETTIYGVASGTPFFRTLELKRMKLDVARRVTLKPWAMSAALHPRARWRWPSGAAL